MMARTKTQPGHRRSGGESPGVVKAKEMRDHCVGLSTWTLNPGYGRDRGRKKDFESGA